MRGEKECHFSGVTSCGRVWRKVPERKRAPVFSNLLLRIPVVRNESGHSDIGGRK